MQIGKIEFGNSGWICPKCNTVYNPRIQICETCLGTKQQKQAGQYELPDWQVTPEQAEKILKNLRKGEWGFADKKFSDFHSK